MELLKYFPYAVGWVAILVGALAMIFPARSSQGFGIPATHAETLAYVRATGARDIFIGLVFLALSYRGAFEALAWTCFFTAGVSLCDFLLTFKKSKKESWALHLAAMPVLIAYGIFVLNS